MKYFFIVICIIINFSSLLVAQVGGAKKTSPNTKNQSSRLPVRSNPDSLVVFLSKLNEAKEKNDYNETAKYAYKLGNYFFSQKYDYKSAIMCYNEVLNIALNTDLVLNEDDLFKLIVRIGASYMHLGDYNEAKKYFLLSLESDSKYKDNTLGFLATIYIHQNEIDSAVIYVNKILESNAEPSLKIIMALTKLEYAYLINDEGMTKETLEQIKTINIAPSEAITENSAWYYLAKAIQNFVNNASDYEKYFNTADSLCIKKNNYNDLAMTLKYRAMIYTATNNYKLAFAFADSAISCLNKHIFALSDPSTMTTIVESRTKADLQLLLNWGIKSYMHLDDENYLEKIITSTELIAGRSTMKLIEGKNFNKDENIALANQITDYQQKISELNNIISKEKDKVKVDILIKERKDTYNEYEYFLSQYYSEINKSNLGEFEPVSFSIIQESLSSEDFVIRYYLYPFKSYAIAFNKNEIWYFDLPSLEQIELSVKALRNYYRSYSSNNSSELFTLKRYSYQLYKDLIEPMTSKIKDKNLIIIPDRILYYLPFEMLISDTTEITTIQNFKNINFLIKEHSISYTPSLSLSYYLDKKEPVKTNDVLMVGRSIFSEVQRGDELFSSREMLSQIENLHDLPGVENELKSIAENIDKNCFVKILLNENANEQQLKKEIGLKEFKYIHIATHGFADDSTPQFSSLVLNTNDRSSEDGLLQSYEIASLDINTDLTVLSACNTGLGKLYSGEGMIGLNQSFFIAGSKSLCLTLWSISDASTSSFMNYFYSNLSAGMTKREALRQAKLSLMSDEKYSSPYYWAPYILSGAIN